jgi:leucyl/phenylalanyl-tRNA--protein transferase
MQEDSDQGDAGWASNVIDGLVAVGGAVTPESLLRAYRTGVFPWSSDPMVTWWSPDPRAIFDTERYRSTRSLIRISRA